jgi:hypothetical protein
MDIKHLNEQINKTFDKAVCVQMIAAFDPETDFQKVKKIVLGLYDFIKNNTPEIVQRDLKNLNDVIDIHFFSYQEKYAFKKDYQVIAGAWNNLFKEKQDVFSYGIDFGWLNEQLDLAAFQPYSHMPYHFKIGLAAHKGYFGIEEEFLLKDAFSALLKAEKYFNLLEKFGELKKLEQSVDKKEFDKQTYRQITNIKYEVSAYSRLTIISFYSFVESFVNSIGFSYSRYYETKLNDDEINFLHGYKKDGRYLTLKQKIEKFQEIITGKSVIKVRCIDSVQLKEPLKSFFNEYESIRNSTVHYSPLKDPIWLKPQDWLSKARAFSKIAIEVSQVIWDSCHGKEQPEYIGKLDYNRFYNSAKDRIQEIDSIIYNI